MELSKQLKTTRLFFNYKQKELAQATKISQQAISFWENGKRIPNIIECIKLADFYNISLDELVGRDF